MPPASLRERAAWAGFLVLLYVAVSVIGWHRTLIDDEIWQLVQAARPLGGQLDTLRVGMVHPPLMYRLSRAWLGVFGHTDDAIKVFVLGLGSASIVAFSCFAPWAGRRWRLASFLFCAAYLQIGGVPNLARGYSLGLLLTVMALFAWERWRRSAENRFLVLWAAAMLLLVYTHYAGVLLLGPFVLANWWYGHRRWLFLGVSVILGLSFLPWVAVMLPVYLSRGLDENIGWVDENAWPVLDARFVVFVLPVYWIGVVTVAEYGGRAGRLVLTGVVLPWVLTSIAVPLARALRQESLQQAVAKVNRSFQSADVILTDRLVGRQVFWEWTRGSQRRSPSRSAPTGVRSWTRLRCL